MSKVEKKKGSLQKKFKSLGVSSANSKINYDKPSATILETFANPFSIKSENRANATGDIYIEATEFTTLCPITRQPDFGTIKVDYRPDKLCLESKSFKLYLMSFRMSSTFHESAVTKIANDLIKLLDPISIRVEGDFSMRGGIAFRPVASWSKEGKT
ncbi:MAG: preQ(1) synthase [Nitrospinota bacterium]